MIRLMGWTLHFYDFRQQFVSVDDVISGIADVETWAKRNGARDGTPFFLDPWGRADALVNAYWRDPLVRGRATGTLRRYALSLKVWLDFLHAIGVRHRGLLAEHIEVGEIHYPWLPMRVMASSRNARIAGSELRVSLSKRHTGTCS